MEVGSPEGCHSQLGSRGVYSIRRPETRPTFPSWASPHNAHPKDLKEPCKEGSLVLAAEGKP